MHRKSLEGDILIENSSRLDAFTGEALAQWIMRKKLSLINWTKLRFENSGNFKDALSP